MSVIKQKFSDRTRIGGKLLKIFGAYMFVLAIVMLIAGGDGLFWGAFFIGDAALLFFVIDILFAKFNCQINQITISEDSVKFNYTKNNKPKVAEFDKDELKIKANICTSMYQNNPFVSIPQAHIIITIECKDGSTNIIDDRSDDIDHSLELLKFLKTMNCFSYSFNADIYENPSSSIKLETAIGNYLTHGVYDKNVFEYYLRSIVIFISTLCYIVLIIIWVSIFTMIGLDTIHLI